MQSIALNLSSEHDWALPLDPLTLFALTQKSKQKRSRLRPSHSKNLRAKG